MRIFWVKTWQSPSRATIAGALLSAIIASILYGFNWHTFYDTRTNFAKNRTQLIAQDIENLAVSTNASPEHDSDFREALKRYGSSRRQLITVSRINNANNNEPEWTYSNEVAVDTSRTQVVATFILEVATDQDNPRPLQVGVNVGVRPRFIIALSRAWSLSLFDYIESPKQWWSEALYNRSIPLYGYLLTIVIVGFGTIRGLYKDQQELLRLEREAIEMEKELDETRAQHSKEIALLHQEVDHIQGQHDSAINHREQLEQEIAGIEREYITLIETTPSAINNDQLLQETADRKNHVEQVLASYNTKVSFYNQELEATRSELEAAESLLYDVENKREGLSVKLQDRNREIRKLHTHLQETQKKMRNAQTDQLRHGKAHIRELRQWDENQSNIEEQLSHWVKVTEHARVNFSKHANSGLVEQQFQKIDQRFINQFFTHANNSEYERGSKRLIRVLTEKDDDAEFAIGKLVIALDDDVGRTLSLRFETRKDAPAPVHIGFMLALLLRSKCRDFQNFTIRTR